MAEQNHDDQHREQDRMENGFDDLRLNATRLRMLTEQGRQQAVDVTTGDSDTDALLQQVVSGLLNATESLADETDRTVDHFHPLYLADKRSDGAAEPGSTDEHR